VLTLFPYTTLSDLSSGRAVGAQSARAPPARRADAARAQLRFTVVRMGIDGIGSSVVIAFAALLWFIYLVPTWLRRREYLSTERNAVRLQQTLRIMAETAQVPDAV